MDKGILVDSINSYHLNGLVESVTIDVQNKNLMVNFVTETKDALGSIKTKLASIDLPDSTISIFNTSELIKLLSITEKEINLDLEKEHNTLIKLNIKDDKYDLSYHLSELAMIPVPPNINEPAQYEYVFSIDKTFVQKFITSFNALNKPNRCIFQTKETSSQKLIEIVIGETGKHTNKIKFSQVIDFDKKGLPIPFSALVLKEILTVNKDRQGKMLISEHGLMKIIFNDENLENTYFIVRLST